MQSLPPDVGQSWIEKITLLLIGIVTALVGVIWRIVNKALDAKASQADMVLAMKRIHAIDEAVRRKAPHDELTATTTAVHELRGRFEQHRVDTAIQHGETLNQQSLMRDELKETMYQQTKELAVEIRRLSERRASIREEG